MAIDLTRFYEQSQRVTDRMTNAEMIRLRQEYRASLRVIQNDLAQMYAKHARDGVLSMNDMAKYNRLDNLEKAVNKELGRLGGVNTRSVKRLASDIYQESFFRSAFAIERGTELNLAFGQLPTRQVEAAVRNPLMDLALNRNQQLVREGVKREITQGIIRGLSYPDVAQNIKGRMEGNLNNVDRIARTEGHRVREQGNFDSMLHAESKGVIMRKRWVATLDNRTRDLHRDLDGQEVDTEEDFVSPSGASGPGPGLLGSAEDDIFCRCSMIAVIAGYEPEVRRNAESGMMPYKTYREWEAAKVKD